MALVQQTNTTEPTGSGDGLAFFFVLLMIVVAGLIVVASIVFYILLLIWIARDAKNRGVENPALWVILVFLLGLIGLIVYLCIRPSGVMGLCPHCNQKRLIVLAKCPHCQTTYGALAPISTLPQ